MEEEKYKLINTINGINEELMQKVISVSERNKNVDVEINNYLINQLGIDENQMSEKKTVDTKEFYTSYVSSIERFKNYR